MIRKAHLWFILGLTMAFTLVLILWATIPQEQPMPSAATVIVVLTLNAVLIASFVSLWHHRGCMEDRRVSRELRCRWDHDLRRPTRTRPRQRWSYV